MCTGRRKRQAEQCNAACADKHQRMKRQAEAATQAVSRSKKEEGFDDTFQCDRSCCDFTKCQSLRAKKFFF